MSAPPTIDWSALVIQLSTLLADGSWRQRSVQVGTQVIQFHSLDELLKLIDVATRNASLANRAYAGRTYARVGGSGAGGC